MRWEGVPVAPTTHTLRLLEPTGGKPLPVSPRLVRSLPHTDRTSSLWEVRFGEGGRLFASGYPSGVVQIWDPHTGKELRRVESPRGYRGSADYALTTDRLDALYVPVEGRKATKLDDPKKPFRIDYDGHVLVWDLATGQAKQPIKAEKGRDMITAYLSPDGARLITVERGGYFAGGELPPDLVRLIDPSTGKASKLGDGYAMPSFSADGKRLYVSLTDYTGGAEASALKVFDRDGRQLATLGEVKGLAFSRPVLSPDGKHMAVQVSKGRINQPGTLRLYDLITGKVVAKFPSGGDFPFLGWPAFSPDGKLLAAVDYDESLRVWDVATRKLVRQGKFPGRGFGVRFAFSPDGTRLAVPARVKTVNFPQPRVYLFDLARGGEPEEVVCPHGWAGGVAFSADGKLLAVGGAGAVHLFDVARK
jgi:WD40 repeat protein